MAKKDFGRRLMPEYLLKYAEELNKNHPDPSASWGGGGGGDYTAGEGIEISDQDVISIDEEVVAKKTDIPDVSDFVTDTDLNTALADYELKSEAFSGSYNDLTDKPTIPVVPSVLSAFTNDVGYITGITSSDVTTALGYTPGTSSFSGSYNDLTDKPTIPTKTSDLQNDSGFITGVTWNDVTGKPTFATVATSGSYNDLSDKPTIPTVDYPVTDVQVDGVSVVSNKVASITMPDVSHDLTYVDISYDSDHSTYNWPDSDTTAEIISKPYKYAFHIVDKTSWSALTYPSQHYMAFYDVTYFRPTTGNMCYIWRGVFACTSAKYPYIAVLDYEVNVGWSLRYEEVKIQWKDVDYKPTFASVATSGNYNDLTDKPTIPDTTNFVTTNTTQTITGYKTFPDRISLADLFGGSSLVIENNASLIGLSYNGRDFELPISKPVIPGSPYTLATTDDIPTVNDATITFTQGGVSKGSITLNQAGNQTIALDAGGGTVAWNDITGKPTFATVATSGSYTDLTDKPSIPSTASSTSTSTVTPTTQTLVFTLDDDSTVTVNVMTGATVSTTTTTTLS